MASLDKKRKTPKQTELIQKRQSPYGGILRNHRKGRKGPRPLSTKHSMHLTLRSSKARGDFSFVKPANANAIEQILKKFTKKYAVRLISVANVGNHLHIHLKLGIRSYYLPFIKSITSTIAMTVTKCSRLNRLAHQGIKHFWDYRPHTRFIVGLRDWLGIKDYIEINKLEGLGYGRVAAQAFVWMSQENWKLSG